MLSFIISIYKIVFLIVVFLTIRLTTWEAVEMRRRNENFVHKHSSDGLDEETIAFRMTLHEGAAAAYENLHDNLWPDLRSALCQAGISEFRIFHQPGTDLLVAFMRRRRNHGLAKLADTPLLQRWWGLTKDLIRSDEDHIPIQIELREVFRL